MTVCRDGMRLHLAPAHIWWQRVEMHAVPKISFYIYPLHLLNYMYDAKITSNNQWRINRNWGLLVPFQSNLFFIFTEFSEKNYAK